MARVSPFRALRYDLDLVGGLSAVIAPPYDVIDAEQRERLAARSPYNVVSIDLPEPDGDGDRYAHAARLLEGWRADGVVVRDPEPALWVLAQRYTGPDGRTLTRRGFFCRVGVEAYGPGRIRPHERTHPGPKEDRLRLTRATKANLSPIFSLFPDGDGAAWAVLGPATARAPDATATDDDGTHSDLWRVTDAAAIAAVQAALEPAELLIADGHHRYETARVYADEVGGEGDHRSVLMFLCSLSDPGLTVFPTHRLLSGLDEHRRSALRATVERLFDVHPVAADELVPDDEPPGVAFGYLDAFHVRPLRLRLRDADAVATALPDRPDAYRTLDTAVLEALILRGAIGLSEDDIAHLRGLDYARSTDDARAALADGRAQAAFFLRGVPVEQVRAVAATGESMPPKSTFFYPKVPTGLVFNPLA